MKNLFMNTLPVYISESDFEAYVLPHLTHKLNHNRLKVSYHYLFNIILYVLESGCSWRTLKPENQLVTWKNIYYHYDKYSSSDESQFSFRVYSIRWQSYSVKKRGENVKYQRRKKCKTTNNLVICDNKYHILAISDCIYGNHNDNFELTENIEILIETLKKWILIYKIHILMPM